MYPSSPENDSWSPHPSPENNSESNLSLLSRKKASPKRHADDTDTLESNEPKRTCTGIDSAIRIALQKKGPPTGILRFFHKVTEEEQQEFLNRSSEEIRRCTEELQIRLQCQALHKKDKERKLARERKRAQRIRMRKWEIAAGLRSSTGKKKHQV